jgi:hypothetical protein
MKKTTTILFTVATVVILGLLLLVYYQGIGSTTETVTTDLTINFYGAEGMAHEGNLTTWTYGGGKWTYTSVPSVDGNTTWVFKNITGKSNVYDQLVAASQTANFTIETQEYPGMGTIVLTINGVGNLDFEGRAWQFYVDNVYGSKASTVSSIKDGSLVRWEYLPNQQAS